MKKTAKYLHSFVIPVPKAKLAAYKKMMRLSAKLWMEHGALEYSEWIGDGLEKGAKTSYPMAVKAKPSEAVIIGFAAFKSAKHANEVMNAVMMDPRMQKMEDLPFDGMRMFWGGFKLMANH